MELLAPNIRSIIFEQSTDDQPNRRVIYFVTDKPPRFFRRIQQNSVQGHRLDGTPRFVYSRMMYPSTAMQDGHRVFNVPWAIQYSRVFKVEHEGLRGSSLLGFDLA